MRKSFTFVLSVCFIVAIFGTSCKKFKDGQTIPAYIHIDSICVNPNQDYPTFGANTANITDSWVYVDDQIIACYELPATFPVLKNGKHKVSIYGGIKVNGIGAARAAYTFYQPRVFEKLNLVEDSIINLNPVLDYYPIDILKMQWKEDFESGTITLSDMEESDVAVERVSGDENLQLPNFPEYSSYSGKVTLPADSLHFYASTFSELKDLPTDGKECLLELDYNCNTPFTVGVIYCENYVEHEAPLVTIQATDTVHTIPQKWKKIYINIGPTCVAHEGASYFKIYFTSHVYKNEAQEVIPNHTRLYYFDNLKLISR